MTTDANTPGSGKTIFLLPINGRLEAKLDGLLTPAEQRRLAELWATQPIESVNWTLSQITAMFEADTDLAGKRLWLPLEIRAPRTRAQQLRDRLTRPLRRRYTAAAATALEAAALAFAVRSLINERQFVLLTDPYRQVTGVSIELGKTAMDSHEAIGRAAQLLRERLAA